MHPRHAELLAQFADPLFADPIVDHYDMYALILQAQTASSDVTGESNPTVELVMTT
jgi:hypothetical protein